MANCESCGSIAIRLRDLRRPLIGYRIVFEPTVTGPELMRRGTGSEGGASLAEQFRSDLHRSALICAARFSFQTVCAHVQCGHPKQAPQSS
jgi:hypothetical protein